MLAVFGIVVVPDDSFCFVGWLCLGTPCRCAVRSFRGWHGADRMFRVAALSWMVVGLCWCGYC